MKSRKISSWLKITGTALFAGIFVLTGVVGSNAGMEQVQAASSGTVYYNFSEITNINDMNVNSTYMFLTTQYGSNDAVVALPNGSARLNLTNVPASGSYSSTAVTDSNGSKAAQGTVAVVQSGNGFDTCTGGYIGYTTRNSVTAWYYGCNGSGVSNVGPFYAYQYDTATFDTSNITIEVTDAFNVPTSRRTYTDSKDLTGLDVKITVAGKTVNVPYFTVSSSDNSVDPVSGDTSVILNIGGVEKTAELKCKQAEPQGQTDYTSSEIKGLTPNGTYVITVDGEKKNVTADANGCIDLTPYAGKTITLTKPGNGGNVADSEPQTITVKDSGPAPSTGGFSTNVNGDETVISGVTPQQEYSFDNGKTWITGTGEDIVIRTGTNILIRKKATETEPASQPAGLTYKNETPSGQPNYKTGKITGLRPNETYIVNVDGKDMNIEADANGCIDLTPYAGKTITITKPGNGENLLNSDSQTIEVKTNGAAPAKEAFEVKVDGAYTSISGITSEQEYSLDNGKTWIAGTGEDIVIGTGEDIQIRVKATETEPASQSTGLVYKNETPCGQPNYKTGKITGLRPNETYIVNVDGTDKNIKADASGCIDLTPYAGKTIIITKPGNGKNLLNSDSQTIEIKTSGLAPAKEAFEVKVDGAYTVISGITSEQEYSLDNGKTWIAGTGEDITVKTGTNVQIREQATEAEPASQVTIIETVSADKNLVSGIVKDRNGNTVAGATVELRNGNTVIATTTTAADGSFAFVGVAAGTYNLVVSYDEKTETYVANIIDGRNEIGNVLVVEEELNSTVDVVEGTPSVVVENIQSQFESIVEENNAGYTKEDKAIVEAGGSAEINVNVAQVAGNVSNAQYISQVANKDGMNIGNVIEILVTKIITDVQGVVTKTGLIELPQLLTFYIDIDKNIQGKETYAIYRYHQGYVDTLTETPNEDGEYVTVSEDGTKLILYVRKFSTYVIGYSDTEKNIENASVSIESLMPKTPVAAVTPVVTVTPVTPVVTAAPKTGDNTPLAPVTVAAMAALMVIIGSTRKNRKHVEN